MSVGGEAFPLIFDGHNDTVISLAGEGFDGPGGRSFFERADKGHIDLPRAREGGLGGGFFAVMARPKASVAPSATPGGRVIDSVGKGFSPESGWPPPMPLDEAQSDALIRLGKLFELER
ncbi:MAG TPA: membrane dipeptidase, partial [Pirellulales bacterium]|nr:membrane dipeptidase [Pirellulales bacterium]